MRLAITGDGRGRVVWPHRKGKTVKLVRLELTWRWVTLAGWGTMLAMLKCRLVLHGRQCAVVRIGQEVADIELDTC